MKDKFLITFPPEVKTSLKNYCFRQGLSLSWLIRKLIYDYISSHHENFDKPLMEITAIKQNDLSKVK
jgi:hypothetical protein